MLAVTASRAPERQEGPGGRGIEFTAFPVRGEVARLKLLYEDSGRHRRRLGECLVSCRQLRTGPSRVPGGDVVELHA